MTLESAFKIYVYLLSLLSVLSPNLSWGLELNEQVSKQQNLKRLESLVRIDLDQKQTVKKDTSADNTDDLQGSEPLEVIYFWATWCVPCRQSSKFLNAQLKRYPTQLKVTAISFEAPQVVTSFLKTDQSTKQNTTKQNTTKQISYYVTSEEAFRTNKISSAYAQDVQFFPFVFILKNQVLMWKGNPTYPKGEFEALLTQVLQGKIKQKESNPQAESLKKDLKRITRQRKKLLMRLADLNRQFIHKSNQLIELKAVNFWEFDQHFWSLYEWVSIKKLDSDANTVDQAIQHYHQELENLVESYLALLGHSADDLMYMLADLYDIREKRLQALPLAETLFVHLQKLTGQPQATLTYPDYYHFLCAKRAYLKGELVQAQQELKHALKLADSFERSEKYLHGFYTLQKQLLRAK